jgi:hypothetical protein
MKVFLKVLLAFFVVLLFGASHGQNTNPSSGPEKQKGISYAAWWPGLYSDPDSDISLAHLAETGANWISLIVTCYQDILSSTRIYASPGTPADEDLIHWFASYQSFIEHYADLASAHGADQFCVGTELLGTSERATEWRKVVAGVRTHYGGPLVYAANHSGEETELTWWDAVDLIGVDAYYSLANKSNPTLSELKAAWRPHVSTLANLATAWQKPIVLTEIGYRSLDGAASHPRDWQTSGTVDLKEQADAYQTAFESVCNQPWFAGIFWWSWGTDPLEGGPFDDGYTPHDKPAEDVLRSWFGARPRSFEKSALPGLSSGP